MKKLLMIPTVLAITSLANVAYAGGPKIPTWQNSFNTNNSSKVHASISVKDSTIKNSNVFNDISVSQYGASVDLKGKSGGSHPIDLKNSFNTKNSSKVSASISIKDSKIKNSDVYNAVSINQLGASFITGP